MSLIFEEEKVKFDCQQYLKNLQKEPDSEYLSDIETNTNNFGKNGK
jgi:hypothetical protein